jgi:hypothetical protein
VALLLVHTSLAVLSLVRENPTIDEVIHLPAGITYWQTHTFKLYAHNPPLVKLIAALPVWSSDPAMAPIYQEDYWRKDPPNKAGVAHEFTRLNAAQYFELFTRARLLMPAFSVLGGLVVFAWSRRLYGVGGGLLSLTLWVFCPNVLAHGRLVTTDVAATALGCGATFLFWRHLDQPSAGRAIVAGLALGLAELSKYSMLLLYVIWPLLWVLHRTATSLRPGRLKRLVMDVAWGAVILVLSVFVINAGYGFEGTGRLLKSYDFVSLALTSTRPRPVLAVPRPAPGDLLARIREYRVNRFRGSVLDGLPVPLPKYYVTGFDEQKQESEGTQARFLAPPQVGNRMGPEGDAIVGYPVYLDGELRQRSWWSYFFFALLYKVPEGTWLLGLTALVVLFASGRSRGPWPDELTLLLVPALVLGVMSFGTNINLGLRYVLPAFPYAFIAIGKLVPWMAGSSGRARRLAAAWVGGCLGLTVLATALIHPHYLAYFNWVSGGARRGSEHLIDSNLDWGQDLVSLRHWLAKNARGERVGLAYFGQIPPILFAKRGEPFDWYLPPYLPSSVVDPGKVPMRYRHNWLTSRPEPGLYAVSASLVRGLPWRVYDCLGSAALPRSGLENERLWAPYEAGKDAFAYFQELTPIAHVGYSILIYRLTPEHAKHLGRHWSRP